MANHEFTSETGVVRNILRVEESAPPAETSSTREKCVCHKWRDDIADIRVNLSFIRATVSTVIGALEGQSADSDIDFADCLRYCALDALSVQIDRLERITHSMAQATRHKMNS